MKTHLIIGALLGLAGLSEAAAQVPIRVFANSAHQTAFQGTPNRPETNLQAAFERETGFKIIWETVPWPQMQQNLLRTLSSGTSQFDVVMIESSWPSRDVLEKLVSLKERQAQALELAKIFPSMLAAYQLDGDLRAVPIRSNPQIIHYNKQIFEERGITAPKTFEDFLAAAEKASHKRADGASVYGLAIKPEEDIITTVKAMGGNVLTDDHEVKVTEPKTIKAIERLRTLVERGALPPNFASMDATSVQTMMREGLAAMSLFGDNYYNRFNDPASSRVAGKVGFFAIPGSAEGSFAPAKMAFWGAAFPANGRAEGREAAWTFIRYLASPAVQLRMAQNGNGPVDPETLANPAFVAAAPYSAASAAALANGASPLPVFEGANQVRDIFVKEAVAAMMGRKSAQAAMTDAHAQIQPLVAARR